MPYTQANRFISLATPLGQDALLLQGFTGSEGLSRLFCVQLDLLSEESTIQFDRIIGQRVTITTVLADGSEHYLNGFVSRFAQRGSDDRFTSYYAEVVPWLWFLTRTADCRIFQNLTVPDILTKIFQDLGFSDFTLRLEGSFERRDYCVQYRETDFHFVCRLMEQYGIFFFFEHEKTKHTLVLANTPSAYQPCPGQPQARFDHSGGAWLEEDVVTEWQLEQELRPGNYALSDYNFETPSTSLLAKTVSTVKVGNNGKYEIYDYPGEYLHKAQGEHLVRLRMEEEETAHLIAQGKSTCRAFTAGYRFALSGHACPAMNASYVLTEVQYTASVGAGYSGGRAAGEEQYTNHFTCIPRDVPYRPPRTTPTPLVQGPQTAVVVGPAGEEIYTDKYGRVKVQFHWDREGKRDENSSCWIRVSYPWAGKGWGAIALPRIGQEVIIDFLEGDPDQPIITGRVYNAEQMPPYGLPRAGMVNGLKSNTTPGGGGYNEISMDDSKGKEKITIHGQKDLNATIEHSETRLVKTGTQSITVKGDTSLTVQEGNRIVQVESASYNCAAKKSVILHGQTEGVGVRGDAKGVSVTGTGKGVSIYGEPNVIAEGSSNATLKSPNVDIGDKNINIMGTNIKIKGTTITISSDGGTIKLDGAGITINGNMIKSSASGSHDITGAIVKIN